jgi:hypothetical protein
MRQGDDPYTFRHEKCHWEVGDRPSEACREVERLLPFSELVSLPAIKNMLLDS